MDVVDAIAKVQTRAANALMQNLPVKPVVITSVTQLKN